MTTHVALSHTPFHLLQLGLITAALPDGDSMVIFHEGRPTDVPGLDSATLIELPGFPGYGAGRRLAAANAEVVLAHSAWNARDTVLHASDLKWLTNNLVYFARARAVRRQQTVLFTDGLGSYLERRDGARTIATSSAKAVLGWVRYGPRHRPLPRNHFGLDKKYAAAVHGFNASLIIGDIPKLGLSIPHAASSSSLNDSGLVVGVPLDAHRFTPDKAHTIVERMARAARAHASGDLAYKPHHFEEPWVGERYRDLGFELVTDPRPAELLIRERAFRHVFGTYSSTLAFGPQYAVADCSAYSVCFEEFADGYLNQRDRSALRELLLGFGVTFL